ncbi:hypothetical protein AYO40_03290 [Planctomycetaceae bacterium SCGC AG-212-D15]|nr:hypothetical protein AYO40_03290 [Planctomycetaceae bacterium SCGC AG-212-D15]
MEKIVRFARTRQPEKRVMGGLLAWMIAALILANAVAITLWMAGAIYYDVCREGKCGRLCAAGWVGGVICLFAAWQPLWQPFAVLLGVAAPFLGWWLRQKPSHHRDWDPTVAVLPRAIRAGETITIENVRNFDYRSLDDFTPRYETRSFDLANLNSVDIIFFNWGSAWMSHPVLVFDFGSNGRVCMSIEVRYRKGQEYSILRSFYRQQELIFLVADERDVILRRTKHGQNQEAYLYPFIAGVEELRIVFLDYVEAINHLYDRPRWYHGLCANCTTTFYRLPSSRLRLDWRVLANGRLDRALYESGRLDRTLPFPELRQIGYLNEVANAAPEDGFGDHIRRELERRRHDR